jgi:DNA-binding GntR family transcriptional regulator
LPRAGDVVTATPEPQFATLDTPLSLRAQIARSLRASLVAGQMMPGATYSVPALAAQFGVSATPAREAMLDLVNEGLLEPIRNKGFRVVEISDHDLDEITELRLLIEAPTVGRLAGRVGDAELERLADAARSIVAFAAAGDLISFVEVDRRLHLDLLALAGNSRIVDTVEQLRARTRLVGLEDLVESGVLVDSANEHLAILDAVRAGDAAEAERLTAQHVSHARGIWAARREDT